MGSTPEITVVIPTRDRADLLVRRALPAAFMQEDVDLEIVVVDDGSRDATPTVLEQVADRRVRRVQHPSSLGVAAARNSGIRHARAPWIAFLDDDDIWAPSKLRTQLDAAASTERAFVYGAALDLDERLNVRLLDPAPDTGSLPRNLLERNMIPAGSSNVIVRASLIDAVGGFDLALAHCADWELWIRLAVAGTAVACAEPLVGYVLHSRNMLLGPTEGIMRELAYVAQKHRSLALRLGASADTAAYHRWLADGHRRAGRNGLATIAYVHASLSARSSRDLLRAAGTAFGERATRVARRVRAASRHDSAARQGSAPSWVELYR
jgi:glycosyltransferase involved in cell wall biosynthesis